MLGARSGSYRDGTEVAPMDFAFSPDQQRWHDAAVRFARARLGVVEPGAAPGLRRESWMRCAAFGAQGLPVPVELGGQGLDLPTTVAALEGLGLGCPDTGLIFAINACLWTVSMPLVRFGTDEQKRRWLPGLCDGTLIGANAASEPDAGSDIFHLATRAARTADGWILNGRKTWVTAGPVADLFVLYATTDPTLGMLGITGFLVPRPTPGLRLAREIPKMGLHGVPMGELVLEDCPVPDDAVLGRAGRGAEVFHASMEHERGAILAAVLGTMRRQLDQCVEHARGREQFGKPIGKFQAVAHRIVEMKLRLETARLLVYQYAWKAARGEDATVEAAMAKWHVSECFVQNSLDAVRTFGASGYAADLGVERDLRDSVGSLIFSGTNDIQKNIIAQRLRL
jgi:alkylation response protein AidB-like acyl-CoA dehydrogenase